MKKNTLFIVSIFLFANFVFSQPVKNYNAAEIKLMIDKLHILGSVLYVAAHPDDENTSALAHFSLNRKLRTGYLALTRGDGGQNLIGSEKGDLIGVIRTYELLEGRKIDHASQFFSRAIDFGYTKSVDETFEKWGKDAILSDIVWTYRTFKPDVIITRFPPGGIQTHGQHTASAQLAVEAFNMAGDHDYFPEQLVYTDAWQPKRIVWDSWLPYYSDTVDINQFVTEDIGAFNNLLGMSSTEISALSRSKHKSQGFGARGYRGSRIAYFKHLAGDSAANSLFEGIDLTWDRISDSSDVENIVERIQMEFDVNDPSKSIPQLITLYSTLKRMNQSFLVKQKIEEVKSIIRAAAGLWFEAIAEDYSIVPGQSIKINFEAVNRSNTDIILKSLSVSFDNYTFTIDSTLGNNVNVSFEKSIQVPRETKITQPYWLKELHGENLFTVPNLQKRNAAVINPIQVSYKLNIEGEEFTFSTPILYRWTDRVNGEQYRNLEVRPPVTINIDRNIFLFNNGTSKTISLNVKSFVDSASGEVVISLPMGLSVDSESKKFFIEKKYGEQQLEFSVNAPGIIQIIIPSIYIEYEGKKYDKEFIEINHDHIPVVSLFPDIKPKFISFDIQNGVHNIGYVEGAGDDVKEILEELGYNVTELKDAMFDYNDLSQFDTIVTGVRAYNTRDRIKFFNEDLLNYVKNGGTLIVQYNVSYGLQTEAMGPYPFTITHDRVTDENSHVKLLDEEHPLLNYPNKITQTDFDNWVQERGLYFARDWDEKYETIIGWNDPGENLLEGGLLYAKYGKGVFIYTGISFFRQLPAGVIGAYKLFVNLLNGGTNE